LGEGPEVVNTVMNLISSGSMEFSCIMWQTNAMNLLMFLARFRIEYETNITLTANHVPNKPIPEVVTEF
jgi:hypothetical protein